MALAAMAREMVVVVRVVEEEEEKQEEDMGGRKAVVVRALAVAEMVTVVVVTEAVPKAAGVRVMEVVGVSGVMVAAAAGEAEASVEKECRMAKTAAQP